ncbi:hypothetical protein H2204_004623 [Knufia peltigerae]|uniref:tRNA/rRNA methyltransferase SpoU type domain-containing protein n=1 Tax=Knufia peltigerae TaxID=1002370 RepID=A0AA38Y788_9EURO|nr:hypothetical protein H2204_004623 [Knufia peltigerae]
MPLFVHNALRTRVAPSAFLKSVSRRSISLTGAIEKGIRDGQYSAVKHERRRETPRNVAIPGRNERADDKKFASADVASSQTTNTIRSGKSRSAVDDGVPTTMPYTTATSEFIAGPHSVIAALKARRRKIYKLYSMLSDEQQEEEYPRRAMTSADRRTSSQNSGHGEVLRDIYGLAKEHGIRVENVRGPTWKRRFTKVTGGRPHGGVLLECSALSTLQVSTLPSVQRPEHDILATIGWSDQGSQNSGAKVQGDVFGIEKPLPPGHSYRPAYRYPFMLLLDRINDVGNFGAIVRSAWFLGVDAILTLDHGTPAPTQASKASSGAVEYMPILQIKSERDFIKSSRANGWKFFVADATPESASKVHSPSRRKYEKTVALQAEGALLQYPCVLVLGNEGAGIRTFMHNLADGVVGIPNARPDHGDVDSLNVSVAAALLTQRFFDSACSEDRVG